MGKIDEVLSGVKVLEEVRSEHNGNITVTRSLVFGTYIQVDNLTQSGGLIWDIWKKVLKKVNHPPLTVNNCLILGLGGGSAAGLVRKYWPDAKITGVDIDPVFVELGKKYLGLDNLKVDIIIEDGLEYSMRAKGQKQQYDLILVDTYRGDNYPEKFETDDFLKLVRKMLSSEGQIIFNRLYYGEKRPQAVKFGNKLEKIFSEVKVFYPEANMMFVCKG